MKLFAGFLILLVLHSRPRPRSAQFEVRPRDRFGCDHRPRGYSVAHMPSAIAKSGPTDPVLQFSVFTPNRLGRLRDLVGTLAAQNVHVLGLAVLDTTDSAIIRLVVDDPQRARELLIKEGFPFTESALTVVEADSTELSRLMSVLLAAELNINYLYSFIPHPRGKPIIGLSMEDNDMAEQVLRRHQFNTLRQADISR